MLENQDAFLEKLFHAHFNELELYANAILRDRGSAQAAVQEAFLVACEKIDEVMCSPVPVAWMKTVVKNIALNMLRRRSRELKLVMPLEELPAEPAAPAAEDTMFLEQYRTLLTQDELGLVKSVVLEGVPHAEKAKELGITRSACYKRVERALQKLRKGLEHEK